MNTKCWILICNVTRITNIEYRDSVQFPGQLEQFEQIAFHGKFRLGTVHISPQYMSVYLVLMHCK